MTIRICGTMSSEAARQKARAKNNGKDVHVHWILFETIAYDEVGEDGRRVKRVERTGNRIFLFNTSI